MSKTLQDFTDIKTGSGTTINLVQKSDGTLLWVHPYTLTVSKGKNVKTLLAITSSSPYAKETVPKVLVTMPSSAAATTSVQVNYGDEIHGTCMGDTDYGVQNQDLNLTVTGNYVWNPWAYKKGASLDISQSASGSVTHEDITVTNGRDYAIKVTKIEGGILLHNVSSSGVTISAGQSYTFSASVRVRIPASDGTVGVTYDAEQSGGVWIKDDYVSKDYYWQG